MRFSAEEGKFLYCVGWLAALRSKGRRWEQLKREWRYCVRQAKARKWRAVKNSFNGWMYEPSPWPSSARRCGTGWTKARAVRSFYRHMAKEDWLP